MNIGKYILDEQQALIAKDDSKYILVVAGAGSGKTLTILGKVKYLIEEKNIKENELLCISFTNKASVSLKEKINRDLNYEIDVFTFHKLALEILKDKNYEIAPPETLEIIAEEFLLEDIKKLPKTNVIFKYLKVENICEYFKKNKEIESLKKLVCTFINLLKANNYQLKDFITFKKEINKVTNIFNYRKEKYLLIIIMNVYIKYTNFLNENNLIDFNDMLTLATKNVNNNTFINNFKYIIIDEFQDTSIIRFNLIKEIIKKTNSSLLVVGDDFQSIYRFSGCTLDLFINFNKLFMSVKVLKIENTYRNSQELIDIAGSFVMKNKSQIKKRLKSNKHIDKPIVIVKYKYKKNALINLIEKIYNETKSEIMILGRNNNDIYNFIDKENFILNENKLIYKKNKNIDLAYFTVHKSKGLESENVIIINLINDTLGFPSMIKEEKILRVLNSNNIESIIYSEERRLFYVALTRTKNKVYLLTPNKNESIFIKELINCYKDKIKIVNIN